VRIAEFFDFQAEYEGSIPFTRSTIFYATLRFCAIWYAFERCRARANTSLRKAFAAA
jgi:hypothetical protein